MSQKEITRINTYDDKRFSTRVLKQHGCFLVGDEPYEIEIISASEAIVKGKDPSSFFDLIKEFRFYSPQIYLFYNVKKELIIRYQKPLLIKIPIEQIQPSQFYVDQEKLNAVSSFINQPEDLIIQVHQFDSTNFISLDGHTRLYAAIQKNIKYLYGIEEKAEEYLFDFVKEAKARNIYTIKDLSLLSHEEYVIKWHQYCDNYFKKK